MLHTINLYQLLQLIIFLANLYKFIILSNHKKIYIHKDNRSTFRIELISKYPPPKKPTILEKRYKFDKK